MLLGVRMEVDFLMRVLAIVMSRDIPGEDHHSDTVEGSIGRTSGRISQLHRRAAE